MKTKYNFLVPIISILLVLLFSYAAISKLMDYHRFISQLRHSPLLNSIAGILTWLIPSSELYIAVLLIVSEWRKTGLLLSAILMFLFTTYITVMLIFFDNIPCSCGGVFEHMTWNQHLIFNIIFTLLAMTGLFIQRQQRPSREETG